MTTEHTVDELLAAVREAAPGIDEASAVRVITWALGLVDAACAEKHAAEMERLERMRATIKRLTGAKEGTD